MTKKNEPKERPILFSGEMVRAILEGRKTQTRRVVKPQPIIEPDGRMHWMGIGWTMHHERLTPLMTENCKYGAPGDRLWVRETWQEICDGYFVYRATPELGQEDDVWAIGGWRPSIFMPRSASRIALEIVNVRVERVRDISEESAKAEGAPGIASSKPYPRMYRDSFEVLWNNINAKRCFGWIVNPWVWVIEFGKVNK